MWAFGAYDGGSNPPGTILSERSEDESSYKESKQGANNVSERGSNPPGTTRIRTQFQLSGRLSLAKPFTLSPFVC